MSETATETVVTPAETEGAETVVTETDGGAAVVVTVEEAQEETPAEAAGDTTVVVVDAPPSEAPAVEQALDIEHRVTVLEMQTAQLQGELYDRPTYEDVRSMTPSPSEVIDTAEAVASAVAEAVVEDIAEDGDVDGGTVRVEELPGGDGAVVSIDPGAPPATEGETAQKRGGLFRW